MKYKTQGLLRDWQHHANELAELTQHADSKTANKKTITQVLTSINVERLLGARVKKVGKLKMVQSTTTPTPLAPALIEAMDENVITLPQFLAAYYSNVKQRDDYVAALKLGLTNIVALEAITKCHHRPKHPTAVQKLFYVFGKDDFRRNDKRVLQDVARAVSIALINQVSGQPLVKSAGRGLYLNRDIIRACMTRPTEATDDQIANGLELLRIVGYLHLAQPNELTTMGEKLSVSHDVTGKAVVSHHIYVVADLSSVNWSLITQNFNLDLHTSIGRVMLTQFLGAEEVHNYFPDLSGGVSQPTINFMVTRSNESADNSPIMSLKAATDTVQSIDGVSASTASGYVNQVLLAKSVQAIKMSTQEARGNGYLIPVSTDSPASKWILPTNTDSLRMCVERLKRANKRGIKVSQLPDD